MAYVDPKYRADCPDWQTKVSLTAAVNIILIEPVVVHADE